MSTFLSTFYCHNVFSILNSNRWVVGRISNFEYLIHLNTLSGRSFLDWAIYPVFPWYDYLFRFCITQINVLCHRVLRDYYSDTLDLRADADLDVGLINDHLSRLGTSRYSSENIDAEGAEIFPESRVFRDLSKPMGALTEVSSFVVLAVRTGCINVCSLDPHR